MEYLKIFTDFARSIEPLDDAERGRLFSAMLAYAESGQAPQLTGNERYVWPTAQLHIDRETEYVSKKRQCGAMGAASRKAKESTAKQTPAPSGQKDKDKDKDKEKDSSSPDGEEKPRPRGPYANVYLTDRDLESFRAEYDGADQLIRRMGEYLASSGKSYQNYLAALRSWARKETAEKNRGSPRERPAPAPRDNSWMTRYIKGQ